MCTVRSVYFCIVSGLTALLSILGKRFYTQHLALKYLVIQKKNTEVREKKETEHCYI